MMSGQGPSPAGTSKPESPQHTKHGASAPIGLATTSSATKTPPAMATTSNARDRRKSVMRPPHADVEPAHRVSHTVATDNFSVQSDSEECSQQDERDAARFRDTVGAIHFAV